MRSTIAANNSRSTATSDIWNVVRLESQEIIGSSLNQLPVFLCVGVEVRASRCFERCSNKSMEVVKMRCEKCGSSIFFVDETVTLVQVDGEIVKTFQGDLSNANCVKCTYPKVYPEYQDFDEVEG